jgi:hypothetical protein
VTLSGQGFGSGEAVDIYVNDESGSTWSHEGVAYADDAGSFTYQFSLPDWFVANYTAAATGETTGWVASAAFTDSVNGTPTASSTERSTGNAATANKISISRPATKTSGDFLLAVITGRQFASTDQICPPDATWTAVRSDSVGTTTAVRQQVFYKFTTNSGNATYDFTFKATNCSGASINRNATGAILRYTNVDTTTPIDIDGGATGSSATGTATLTAPAVTTTQAGDRVVSLYGSSNSGTLTGAGFSVNITTGNPSLTGGEDFTAASAGSTSGFTTERQATQSGGAATGGA